jgi:hypothetical protein
VGSFIAVGSRHPSILRDTIEATGIIRTAEWI